MSDTDTNTSAFPKWSKPSPTLNGGYAISTTLKSGFVLKVTTDVKGNQSCSCSGTAFNTNLDANDVALAAKLYYDDVWPSIVEGEKKLGPKPEISKQTSVEEVKRWTAANNFCTKAQSFADGFRRIYQSNEGSYFMPKAEAKLLDPVWRECAEGLFGNQEPTEDAQTAAPTILDSSPSWQ